MSWIVVGRGIDSPDLSNIVGVFTHQVDAYNAAKILNKQSPEHGLPDRIFEVYPLPAVNTVTDEFIKRLPLAFHEHLQAGKYFDVDKFKSFAPKPFDPGHVDRIPPDDYLPSNTTRT